MDKRIEELRKLLASPETNPGNDLAPELKASVEREIKFDALMQLPTIDWDDYEILTEAEKDAFDTMLGKRLDAAWGNDTKTEALLTKLEKIAPSDIRHRTWDRNHTQIETMVVNYLREYGLMPSKTTIASKLGISRQTVQKHFNEFESNPNFIERLQQYRLVAPGVMDAVVGSALKGNMKAAKMFLDTMGKAPGGLGGGNTVINTQNNYIQINNTVLSPDVVQRLSKEQLERIEGIINEGTG